MRIYQSSKLIEVNSLHQFFFFVLHPLFFLCVDQMFYVDMSEILNLWQTENKITVVSGPKEEEKNSEI